MSKTSLKSLSSKLRVDVSSVKKLLSSYRMSRASVFISHRPASTPMTWRKTTGTQWNSARTSERHYKPVVSFHQPLSNLSIRWPVRFKNWEKRIYLPPHSWIRSSRWRGLLREMSQLSKRKSMSSLLSKEWSQRKTCNWRGSTMR